MPSTQRTRRGGWTETDAERASSMIIGLFPKQQTTQTSWTFNKVPVVGVRLQFRQKQPPPKPQKRSRALADVDCEHSCMQKKKRRLRRFLVTSRLSPQFSYPASNIVDRGSSKIAVWAKRKALGRNLLRKMAILNQVGRQTMSGRETEAYHRRVLIEQERRLEEPQRAKWGFDPTSAESLGRPILFQDPATSAATTVAAGDQPVSHTKSSPSSSLTSPSLPSGEESSVGYRSPNEAYAYPSRVCGRAHLPVPPSSLGLSNYDAFDEVDDLPDPYAHLNEGDDEPALHVDSYDSPSSRSLPAASPCTAHADVVGPIPQLICHTDFDMLNLEPVVHEDHGQVAIEVDAVWPGSSTREALATVGGCASPDFHQSAAAAAAAVPLPLKRADSFMATPELRPVFSTMFASPNFDAWNDSSQAISDSKPSSSPNSPA